VEGRRMDRSTAPTDSWVAGTESYEHTFIDKISIIDFVLPTPRPRRILRIWRRFLVYGFSYLRGIRPGCPASKCVSIEKEGGKHACHF
ncbi:MAG: hypothetical protein Q9192_008019, partial [Flavoplaca navasiana]